VAKMTGGCHCGAVKYEIQADVTQVISCNCSICTKRGSLLTFIGESSFKLLSGHKDLTEYKFNKHIISHLFCKKCGILSFARGKDDKGNAVIAINVRCLDGIDPDKLTCMPFNGRDL
jgi:hypothetical protein